jgi:hypothetical protein
MAAFFFLLAIVGGALIGDLIWENTAAGEVTVLGRTVDGYPRAGCCRRRRRSASSSRCCSSPRCAPPKRDARRRQLRAMKRDPQHRDVEPEGDYARWLDESFGQRTGAADADPSPPRQSEPLYEQTRRERQQ